MRGTLTALDLTVVLVYLAVVVGKGGLLAKKQRDLEDYFLAGRKMGFFAVGISIIASLLSAITYLGAPAEAYGHDLRFSLTLLCIPLVTPIVLRVFLPFFYQLNLYTAYEYLERRFNLAVRTVASVFFMFWRLCWMALVIYAPSLALSEFVDLPWWAAVLILGVLSTAYTTLGGMRAVIWTDVVQFFVLYGGVLLVGGLTLVRSGVELGAMWAEALAAGKLQVLDFRLDPTIRVTTPAIFLGWTFGALAAYATDQVAIQRYLTTKNFAESRRSLIFHALVIVPVSIVFYWVGSLLWAFYHHRPELLSGFDESRPDRILPFFIVQQLPLGLKGILIAALFAATMSSIDSGINSVTTATIVDFYQGL
ncbi:MAG TPA: hypothetical protein EYP85_16925, partial [Armatimonadetes bacterium]|nr:hypothetical protein [Armatimonadota bacterium]